MSEHKKYLELLDAILRRSLNHLFAIYKLVELWNKEKNQIFAEIAQFEMYNILEGCGQFLLVKDQYPKKLSESLLKKIGYNNHNTKIKRFLRLYRSSSNPFKYPYLFPIETIIKYLRNLRDNSMYIDYKNGKVIYPKLSTIGNTRQAEKMADIIENILKFCQSELENFKKNPLL